MQTTRPSGFVPRLLLFVAVFLFFNHVTMGYQLGVARGPFRGQPVARYIETLAMLDQLATRYPEVALSVLAGTLLLLLLLYRGWVAFRNKRFTAKTTGMADEPRRNCGSIPHPFEVGPPIRPVLFGRRGGHGEGREGPEG